MRPELERRLAVMVEPIARAVLDGVREHESEPDRVRVELGLVPVFADERPLLGLAGLLDWRASGRLSAILRSSYFSGKADEQLLTLGERRWPIDRLVLVGLGLRSEFDEDAARRFASRCIEIATGLGSEAVLIALPTGPIERGLVELAFDSLLGAIERASIAAAQAEQAPVSEAPSEAPVSDATERDPGESASTEIAAATESATTAETESPSIERDATETTATPDGEGAKARADHPALQSQPQPEPPAAPVEQEPEPAHRREEPRWWVVADEAVVARLRRVRSGPPRAARGGPSLYT